jgi:hypothetical protein
MEIGMYPEVTEIMGWVRRELTNMNIWNDNDQFTLHRHRDWRDNRGHEGWVAIVLRIGKKDEKDMSMYGMRFTHGGLLLKYQMFDFRESSEGIHEDSMDNAFRSFKENVEKHVMVEEWYLTTNVY